MKVIVDSNDRRICVNSKRIHYFVCEKFVPELAVTTSFFCEAASNQATS